MNIRKSFVFMAVAMAVALLRAGIATEDALMEVLWFEQAVTEAKSGWTDANNSITYADSKYTLDADSAVSYTPTAQTGTAVRQVFDLDPEPVSELPEVDAGVQTSFVLTEEGKYMAWGKATSNAESASWIELGAKGTGAIALEIDYATTPATIRYYQGDEQFGATLFSANNATKVTKYDFTGSGTLASLTGTQTDTVAAMIGTVKYHTYADALAAVKEGEKIKVVDVDNLPEGYVADADGYLVQETTTYVAQVGDTKYATLQEALTAGGTVTLLADLTVNDWQIVNKAVTLDLGGFKLTGANFPSGHDAVLAVSRGGTLTVKNGTVDGSAILAGIKLTASNALDRIDPSEYTEANKATLIVDGATVIGNQYGICGNGNIGRGNTAVTVNSGLVKAVNTGAEESVGIYNPQAGTVVVAGGTVQGVYYGIYAKSGTVTITGGTVKALAEEAVEPTVYNNGTNGKGYAVVLEKGTASGGYANGLTASVTGGSFESVGAPLLCWTRDAETAPALEGFVEGGSFKGAEMPTDLIKVEEGKVASWGEADENGYTVAIIIDAPKNEMLYYFPLEGTVENVGGTRGDDGLTVADATDLCWDESRWMGSPFGDKSLRATGSQETKVYKEDGLVPAGSRWAVSFWVYAARETGNWKDACGFKVGDNIYKVEKTGATPKALQIYGNNLSLKDPENPSSDKPIVCDAQWVNIIAMCNESLNGVDIYANGVFHASLAIENADQLKGFYFTSVGLPDRRDSWLFTDEVSIWNCALDADQIAYLAQRPAKKEILDGETDIEPLPIATVEINGVALEGTYNMADALKAIADAADVETAKITLVKPCTDGAVEIPAKVTLDVNGKSLAATVTGAGTLKTSVVPTLGEGWTGTVDLTGLVVGNGINFSNYGTEASTVKVPAFEKYLAAENVNTTLELTGDVFVNDGYGNTTPTVAGIKGAYTFKVSKFLNKGPYTFKFLSVAEETKFEIGESCRVMLPAKCENEVKGAAAKVIADGYATYFVTLESALAGITEETIDTVTVIAEAQTLPTAWSEKGYQIDANGKIVKPKGWDSVTDSTDYLAIEGLTSGQRAILDFYQVPPTKLATWAKNNTVAYGDVIDLEAFALNCTPADKAAEVAKLKVTITMVDGEPVVALDGDATKSWNIQPMIKGKVSLTDETWHDKKTGDHFFKAIVDLFGVN